jgi:hypothetical protein
MLVQVPIKRGADVLFSYGTKPNLSLVHYGFAMWDNPYEVVNLATLVPSALLEAVAAITRQGDVEGQVQREVHRQGFEGELQAFRAAFEAPDALNECGRLSHSEDRKSVV